MEIRQIKFGSKDYEEMKELRIEALLSPIGIPGTYIVPDKEKNDVFIGAFDDKQIIGCCILTRKDDATVQLRQMAVTNELQGKGIGGLILREAEKIAAGEGFTRLLLHARDQVMDFYGKAGYEITEEPFTEVGIPHHKMHKYLR